MVMQFNEKMKSIHGEQEVDQIQHSKFTKEKIGKIVKLLKYHLKHPNFIKWDKKLFMTVSSWAMDSVVPFEIQNLAMPLLIKYISTSIGSKNKTVDKLISETNYYDKHISK